MMDWLVKLRKSNDDGLTVEQKELVEEYRRAVIKIHQARNAFENITEPEMIDSCVFELNAARSNYSYLLSRINGDTQGQNRKTGRQRIFSVRLRLQHVRHRKQHICKNQPVFQVWIYKIHSVERHP